MCWNLIIEFSCLLAPQREAGFRARGWHGPGVAVCGLQPLGDVATCPHVDQMAPPSWQWPSAGINQGGCPTQISFFPIKLSDKMIASYAAECWNFRRKQRQCHGSSKTHMCNYSSKQDQRAPRRDSDPPKKEITTEDIHERSYGGVTREQDCCTENSGPWGSSHMARQFSSLYP